MPANLPMFLPIGQATGGSVFLPGLAPEASGQYPLFPPGTYPIMGSGEYTATLYPLAEQVPPQPVPLPAEVASVALQGTPGALAGMPEVPLLPAQPFQDYPLQPMPPPQGMPFPEIQALPPQGMGMPDVQLIPPAPQDMGMIPPPMSEPPAGPGLRPLADPLPTSVPDVRYPWPPMLTPMPDVPLYAPNIPPLPQVDVPPPMLRVLSGEVPPTPEVPTLALLVNALRDVREQQTALADFSANRGTLKAGVPEANLGKVVWERNWSGG